MPLYLPVASTTSLLEQGVRFWYRQAMLDTVPVAYWRLGEPSGTNAVDEMGANDGTYVNTPTLGVAGLLTGDPDTAVTFASASSEYVRVLDAAALRMATTLTVVIWGRTSTAAYQMLVNKRASAPWWETHIDDSGHLVLSLNDGVNATEEPADSVGGNADGVLHMWAFTRSGSTVTFYRDGVQLGVTRTLSLVGSTVGTSDMGIGNYGDSGGNMFNGTLDEPAIWNRALSAAEIAALYRIGSGT